MARECVVCGDLLELPRGLIMSWDAPEVCEPCFVMLLEFGGEGDGELAEDTA